MTGKREQREKEKKDWEQILEEEMEGCGTLLGREWIEKLKEERGEDRAYIWKRYQESGKDADELRRLLHLGVRILENLPFRKGQAEYLAVFAAMLTGNPHAFDDGTKDGQLLSMVVDWETGKTAGGRRKRSFISCLEKTEKIFICGDPAGRYF